MTKTSQTTSQSHSHRCFYCGNHIAYPSAGAPSRNPAMQKHPRHNTNHSQGNQGNYAPRCFYCGGSFK